jgi:hypothetical protein
MFCCFMKRIAIYAAVLLVVAGLFYRLGRKQGAKAIEEVHLGLVQTDAKASEASRLRTNVVKGEELPDPGAWARSHSTRSNEWFLQGMASAQAGYAATQANLVEALTRIETLPISERKGFITGVFAFVGRQYSPAEALEIYKQQGEKVRGDALRALVAEWISGRSNLDEDRRHLLRDQSLGTSAGRLGLEVELAAVLASSQPEGDLSGAWLDAFANHPGRSEMLSVLAGKMMLANPDRLLERTEGWTTWERERAARSVLADWASTAPQDAWNWYQGHQDRWAGDVASSILETWAGSDPEAVKGVLNSLSNEADRRAALQSIGKALAQRATQEAVTWAESLPNTAEREIANDAIYEATPRGIGAVLNFDSGFPTLRSVLPGSPLEGTGVQPGDQIVEIRQADGPAQNLYGVGMESAVKLIRGEPGSELELRVLRPKASSGGFEEILVPVRRAQLYFDNSSLPKRN